MFQVLSFIFLAFAVSIIWGILDFDGGKNELLQTFRIGIYIFIGLVGMAAGLGIIITFLS